MVYFIFSQQVGKKFIFNIPEWFSQLIELSRNIRRFLRTISSMSEHNIFFNYSVQSYISLWVWSFGLSDVHALPLAVAGRTVYFLFLPNSAQAQPKLN